MQFFHTESPSMDPVHWSSAALDYWIDRSQRTILFWDILRKRGNNYNSHLKAGQPPVLVFDYEMVMDGRTFHRPVNYSLLRILERRQKPDGRMGEDRRNILSGQDASKPKGLPPRPIIIIDPRAGHGPGIGGSKLNSQIGVAMEQGHPVYFVMFYTNPEPGQTIADIQAAEIRFIEEVAARHPKSLKPAIIGNCQAGWAAALIGADRPDVAGTMVFNGSPLSYWGGVEGANPMRYRGGLCGGVWLTSLWSDLGNGRFDGANLVAGFEDLNPANTYWKKLYHVFANVDTEEKRFLDFAKWWGGFFKMNRKEIHFIVSSLFVGNELEKGNLHLEEGRVINLKNFADPIVVFASEGDNITPPPQALNWIKKVYGTVEEIKRCGQVIVYMVHPKIGHLGIFTSSKVARLEHEQIIGSLGILDLLRPGLYEMVIEQDRSNVDSNEISVRFEERRINHILELDDGLEDENAFKPVNMISRFNDQMYRTFLSPWVQKVVSEPIARRIRSLHPLRLERYALSDLNLAMYPVKWAARDIRSNRFQLPPNNPFVAAETLFSDMMILNLNHYRDMRDRAHELMFKSAYGQPQLNWFFDLFAHVELSQEKAQKEQLARQHKREMAQLRKKVGEGGFTEAVVRIWLAVGGANHVTDKRQMEVVLRIVLSHQRLRKVSPQRFIQTVKEQARILELGKKKAIMALDNLLPTADDRIEAFEIAQSIAWADMELDAREKKLLAYIQDVTVSGLPMDEHRLDKALEIENESEVAGGK